jgi:integrase
MADHYDGDGGLGTRIAATAPARSADVLPHIPRDPSRWREVLHELLRQNNWAHGRKPKGVSYRTMAERRVFLYAFFRELRNDRERSYRIDPRSLRRVHVEHAVRRWVERDLSAGTIQSYLSHLRVFAQWIGKAGLVVDASAYVQDPLRVKRTYSATEDKSWEGREIDIEQVLALVDRKDERVGAQLRLCDAFGLRVKEAIMLRPHLAVVGSQLAIVDEGRYERYLEVIRGTKGGRLRFVPIVNERQREALEHACRIVRGATESLGHPGLRLHQAYMRFYHVVRACGIRKDMLRVTAHGLRHGFAHRRYEDHTGQKAPIVVAGSQDRAVDDNGRLGVSRELGHARKSISAAYLGGLQMQGRLPLDEPVPGGPG